MVRTLYQSYAQPFARIVCGAPTSWDPTTAATSFSFEIKEAQWSPCNKFIAISARDSLRVDILDSTTLQRLQRLETLRETAGGPTALTFSPDMRMLISLSKVGDGPEDDEEGFLLRCIARQAGFNSLNTPGALVVSWDLQTGRVVSAFSPKEPDGFSLEIDFTRIECSTDGKMVGILRRDLKNASISIYDNISGVFMHDCGTEYFYDIWTHKESLRIATAGSTDITIYEVGFAPGATCKEVEIASIPENVIRGTKFESGGLGDPQQIQFLPASDRLALVYVYPAPGVLIWGIRDSKYLLYDLDTEPDFPMAFSSDGRFFAYLSRKAGVLIWRETSTRHEYYATLPTITQFSGLDLSPNGESIMTVGTSAVQLWSTKNVITTSPSPGSDSNSNSDSDSDSDYYPDISTRVLRHPENFLLDFHPDKSLAAVIRRKDNVAKVLDLKSGAPQLTIKTLVPVFGLRLIGDTVVAVTIAMAITWNLPEGNVPPGGKMSFEDAAQSTEFGDFENIDASLYNSDSTSDGLVIAASISPDFRYIAVLQQDIDRLYLCLCNVSTRHHRFGSCIVNGKGPVWFTPGGDVCCTLRGGGAEVVTIPQDGVLEVPKDAEDGDGSDDSDDSDNWGHLRKLVATQVADIKEGSWGCPWLSSGGYRVTKDEWVRGMGGKRLLMLPPPWRSFVEDRVWNGRFLALVHGTLPEPVILELEP